MRITTILTALVLSAALVGLTAAGVFASNLVDGVSAGAILSSGDNNVLFGDYAGWNLTSGSYNTCLGVLSCSRNNHSYNTIIGEDAGEWMNSSRNTVAGTYAGDASGGGADNVFLGAQSGGANSTGDFNVFVGSYAGAANTTASYNTFLGAAAGQSTTTGAINTFIGSFSGNSNINGTRNTYIGCASGYGAINGNHNIFIGGLAGTAEKYANTLYIAAQPGVAPLPLIYGEFSIPQLVVFGSLTAKSLSALSDGRLKQDITPIEAALDKTLRLRGVSYLWKTDENPGRGFSDTRQLGLLAQEVEKVLPEVVQTDAKGYKSLSYHKIVPFLIEAVKERQRTAEKRAAEIAGLEQELAEISQLLDELSDRLPVQSIL